MQFQNGKREDKYFCVFGLLHAIEQLHAQHELAIRIELGPISIFFNVVLDLDSSLFLVYAMLGPPMLCYLHSRCPAVGVLRGVHVPYW